MSNFYNDNPDLKHHLSHPLMRKIVEMKSVTSRTLKNLTMHLLTMRMQWTHTKKCLR